jgi:SAM-dependent methyltransferase
MSPPPTDADLARYYSVYTTTDCVDVRGGRGSKYPRLRKYFHVLSGDVDPRDFIVVPTGGRVLDYGSGEGTYLHDFHQRGVDIWGAEISDVLVAACTEKGLRVRKTPSFDAIPFADGEFDVVYLMQVFEHLRNPRAFMLELSRILKKGGMLYLAVPNAASVWRRIFGLNWVSGWFAPFHVAHFTSRALGGVGSDCGLEVCGAWSRTPESWFRLNLKAVLYPRDSRLDIRSCWLDRAMFRYPLLLLLRLIECFVRERDCLVAVFRKP